MSCHSRLLLLLLALLPPEAIAQLGGESSLIRPEEQLPPSPEQIEEQQRQRRLGLDSLQGADPAVRARVEQAAVARASRSREKIFFSSEPWLSPGGEQLAAVVGRRQLTLFELRNRAAFQLNGLPALPNDLEQDREVMYQSQILARWIEATALAEYAKQYGLSVASEEVDRALAQVMRPAAEAVQAGGPGTGGGIGGGGLLTGIDERELRQEVEDGVLGEKIVAEGVRQLYDEQKMRELFQANPLRYIAPTRVRAWELYMPSAGKMDAKEEKKAIAKLNDWRRRLARAKSPEDYGKLHAELGDVKGLMEQDERLKQAARGNPAAPIALVAPDKPVLIDLGWVAIGDSMPPAILVNLFNLKPGEASQAFKTDSVAGQSRFSVSGNGGLDFGSGSHNLGYCIVKIDERIDGPQPTFENARPQIEAELFSYTRDLVLESAKLALDIHSDSSGLKIRKQIAPAQAIASAAADLPTTVTAADPDLKYLRRDLKNLIDRPSPPAVDPALPSGWDVPPVAGTAAPSSGSMGGSAGAPSAARRLPNDPWAVPAITGRAEPLQR